MKTNNLNPQRRIQPWAFAALALLNFFATLGCDGFISTAPPLLVPRPESISSVQLKIDSFTPQELPVAGGVQVDVFGSGFNSALKITIGGKDCVPVNLIDSSHATCTAPALSEGDKQISVSQSGSNEVSSPAPIQVVDQSSPPPPDDPPTANSCASDEVLYNQKCYKKVRVCPIPNGTGEQTFSGGSYGTCKPVACNEGYQLSSGLCQAIPGFPTAWVSACPTTIPSGQATNVQIGASNMNTLSVWDGSKKVFEKTGVNGGISFSLPLAPTQTTTYQIKVSGPNGTLTKSLTISVLSPTDTAFKVSPTLLTATAVAPVSGIDNGAPFAQGLNWTNTSPSFVLYTLTAKTATGVQVLTSGYGSATLSLNQFQHYSTVPTTYTLMACSGSFFSPTIAEVASVDVVPPKPALNPVDGSSADCKGVYQYKDGANTKVGYLNSGTGNANFEGSGTTIASCVDFFVKQKQLCDQQFGSCQVFGYFDAKDSTINGAMVSYRVYPTVVSGTRKSSGVCTSSFFTTSTTHPTASGGPQFLASTDTSALSEDCEALTQLSFLEISTLSSQGVLAGASLTGVEYKNLIDLQTNKALINFKADPK